MNTDSYRNGPACFYSRVVNKMQDLFFTVTGLTGFRFIFRSDGTSLLYIIFQGLTSLAITFHPDGMAPGD